MDKWSTYLRGIGVGLIIAWVTSALAYFNGGLSTYAELILLEFILSVIFLLVSYIMDTKGKNGKRHR